MEGTDYKVTALTWLAENSNMSEKTCRSLVNRLLAQPEKEPYSLTSAIAQFCASLGGLSASDKTSEVDKIELAYLVGFMRQVMSPVAKDIDEAVKARQAKSAEIKKSTKRAEVWADTQEEAIALRDAQTPTKPTRKARTTHDTETDDRDEAVIRDILAQLATLRISK